MCTQNNANNSDFESRLKCRPFFFLVLSHPYYNNTPSADVMRMTYPIAWYTGKNVF